MTAVPMKPARPRWRETLGLLARTRALGMQDNVVVDLVSDEPRVGDVYLLCSDGLTGMLADEQIREIVESTDDVSEMCQRLIAMANDHGGDDNITALVIRFHDEEPLIDPLDCMPPASRLRIEALESVPRLSLPRS